MEMCWIVQDVGIPFPKIRKKQEDNKEFKQINK
jgi:hypothetical protein